MIRANIVDFGEHQGKDSVRVTVRAASEFGAALAARVAASSIIPIRDQRVFNIESKSESRFLDKWVIDIVDTEEMSRLLP